MSQTPFVTPPPQPRHQCVNASCGCNDLISAGTCSEWCMAHTVEYADVLKNRAALEPCGCAHATCLDHMPARIGSPTEAPGRGHA